MVEARVWRVVERPQGTPEEKHFECTKEVLEPCPEGGVVVQAEWLSVDPYMRFGLQANTVVEGAQVAKILVSRSPEHPVGGFLVCSPGWRSLSVLTKEHLSNVGLCQKLPDMGAYPRSLALGILGMPGVTAYFGLQEVCRAKAGDTVLVSGAAGAVGASVCQLAKNKGCLVIAFAGSEAKVAHLRALGVDHVFNYKTDDIAASLKLAAPKGINCYFDNVGGQFTATAVPFLSDYCRVAVCGAISSYNTATFGAPALIGPYSEGMIITKQLVLEGFMANRWYSRWEEGIQGMKTLLDQGKLKYKESITEGFDNMPKAFIGLFKGDNFGKAVVKA